MKKFFHKRWCGIPVGIITGILLVCLLGGSVLAWHAVTTGTAVVTVDEAITYEVTDQTSGEFDIGASTWTVSMFPGETEIIYMTVSNASSASLDVVATYTISPSNEGITVTGNAGIKLDIPVTIPGNDSGPFSIEVHAAGDAADEDFTIVFTLNRQ